MPKQNHKQKPPKDFKNLPSGDKKFIKDCEKSNRLADEVINELFPSHSNVDGSPNWDSMFSTMLSSAFMKKIDKKTKKINSDVDKEFKG